MKEDNNIDRYFKENLYDFQASPPKEAWNAIEQDLKKSARKLFIPVYIKVAAGIALMLSIAALLWKVTDNTDSSSATVITEELEQTESISKEPGTINVGTENELEIITAQSEINYSEAESDYTPNNQLVAKMNDESFKLLATDIQEPNEEFTTVASEPDIESLAEPANIASEQGADSQASDDIEETPEEKAKRNELIIQQNLMALEESSKEKIQKSDPKWIIGGQAGPQYSYRDVSVNPDYQNYQDYDKFEDGMIAFAGGVNVQLQAAKRFSIQSGVYYSKIGQEVSSIAYGNVDVPAVVVADEPNVAPSIGTLSKDNRQQQQNELLNFADNTYISEGPFYTEQYFEFVEIPLVFKYFIIDRKLDVSVNGGLWTNILVGNKAITTGNNDYRTEEETQDINTLNYSGSLGVGLNYPVTSNLLISLDPIFKYYLSPINSNPETEVHPYTFGIMTGINFSF